MGKKVAIIASNGGLIDGYKVFNIAAAAAAMDQEVAIFFTFEGLNLIHKKAASRLSVEEGKQYIESGLIKANVPAIQEFALIVKDLGVRFIGCQTTIDIMGMKKEDFVDGMETAGAVTFLDFAKDADITLTF